MQRAGIEREEIHLVRKAYKTIFSSGLILENAELARAEFGGKSHAVDEMLRFILEREAARSLTTPGSRRRKGAA